MDACPLCQQPYGQRKRCYSCQPGKLKTGSLISCEWCGTKRYVQRKQLDREACRFCSRRCRYASMKGKLLPGKVSQPIGHKYINKKTGYVFIKVRPGRGGYELEHRVIMAKMLGRPLLRDEEVHHKNLRRSENDENNLEVKFNGEHQHFHGQIEPRSKKIPVTCERCGVIRFRKPSRAKTSRYCGNDCRLAVMHDKAREYHAVRRAKLGFSAPLKAIISYGPDWHHQCCLARARDGHRCQRCGLHEDLLKEQLSVAHIKPFRSFSREALEEANRLENLISLCRSCHMKFDHKNGLR